MAKISYKVLFTILLILLLTDISLTKNKILGNIFSGSVQLSSAEIIKDDTYFEIYEKLRKKVFNINPEQRKYNFHHGYGLIDHIDKYNDYFDLKNYNQILNDKYRKNDKEVKNTSIFFDDDKVFFVNHTLDINFIHSEISFFKQKNIELSNFGIKDSKLKDGEYIVKKVEYHKLKRIENGKEVMKDIPEISYMLKTVKNSIVTLRKFSNYQEINGELYYNYEDGYVKYDLKKKTIEYHRNNKRIMNFYDDSYIEKSYAELKEYFHSTVKFCLLILIYLSFFAWIKAEKK